MASIKPIESSSVHRIQSGQVIVDLCSVVKELVENSIDAGATSIEIRFKNSGLDAIEVADNGSGIAQEDYESVALKHYTSKLRTYDDLSLLNTFGFRGEALSSLCALSDLHIVTAQENEAPKATRLDFEQSGKLKGTSTVAAQKGTTIYVGTIFKNLPVRRQELTKNIKREFHKVLELLQAYACISTTARMTVSNVAAKGKKSVQFATKANQTTRENIANVYSTKTTALLIPLDLQLDMQTTAGNMGQRSKQVRIVGHVSRPTVGEGRQTSDRQMFFVNGRPCNLPQIAKAMNEVYKTFNLSQSPFIFADVQLDTNDYDVNVSPDKRTIMLHEQGELLESLKVSLAELFDNQRQSVPQAKSTATPARLPAFSPLTVNRPQQSPSHTITSSLVGFSAKQPHQQDLVGKDSPIIENSAPEKETPKKVQAAAVSNGETVGQSDLIQKLFTHKVQDRTSLPARAPPKSPKLNQATKVFGEDAEEDIDGPSQPFEPPLFVEVDDDAETTAPEGPVLGSRVLGSDIPFSDHSDTTVLKKTQADSTHRSHIDQHNSIDALRPSGTQAPDVPNAQVPAEHPEPSITRPNQEEEAIPSTRTTPVKAIPGPVPSAFDRMRPLRTPAQKATITIGDHVTTTTIGSSSQKLWNFQTDKTRSKTKSKTASRAPSMPTIQSSLRAFAAPGTQMRRDADEEIDDSDADEEAGYAPIKPFKRQTPLTTAAESVSEKARTPDSDGDGSENSSGEEDEAIPVPVSEDDSDGEFLDDDAKRQKEDARVARLIQEAETRAARPSEEGAKRAGRILKGGRAATTNLLLTIPDSTEQIIELAGRIDSRSGVETEKTGAVLEQTNDESTAEERLSLTVSKDDFARMRIAGQFNLGFIIALRRARSSPQSSDRSHANNELFIIDQHASDEKFNFERLQATTAVQNQPLVHPQQLDLTAIEEEIIIDNQHILQKNGFEVEVDESGDRPVGKRCTLTRLPMSKEVTFSTRDLEELIALLIENPSTSGSHQRQPPQPSLSLNALSHTQPAFSSLSPSSSFLTPVLRPTAVRKMFAMRACRSSVMIGRTLNHKQMAGLVSNMGRMEKPWNCPHGRPTMRHLYSFGQWGEGWSEGDGVAGMEDDGDFERGGGGVAGMAGGEGIEWNLWLGNGEEEGEDEEDEKDGDMDGEEDEDSSSLDRSEDFGEEESGAVKDETELEVEADSGSDATATSLFGRYTYFGA